MHKGFLTFYFILCILPERPGARGYLQKSNEKVEVLKNENKKGNG
jgi:hypothetical protein